MELKETLLSKHLLLNEEEKSNQWIANIRKNAIQTFEKKGFPTKKLEDWKYLNLAPLLKSNYKINPAADEAIEYRDIKKYLIHDIESYKIIFINGKYSSWLSETTHDLYDICILSSALTRDKYKRTIKKYFNQSQIVDESLVSLNTAFAQDGAYIHIPDNIEVEKPIQILFLSVDHYSDVMHHPRNLIAIGKNSKVQIIERHQNLTKRQTLTNSVSEIFVDSLSQVDYYKIQNDHDNSSLIDHTVMMQNGNSIASVNTYSLGGKLLRNNLHFYQRGEYCESNLNGITILADSQTVDHHTLVDHKYPNGSSNELYKGIFDEKSRGIFNGKVMVHSEAQKTDAFQQNNNVLLTDTASIDTKPQLEIFADDVKCSHGCTIGQLDEEALFYMQTRGIPKKEAKALLLYAFANEALNKIEIPKLKTKIDQFVADKLGVLIDFEL